jgi:hypothetical protein
MHRYRALTMTTSKRRWLPVLLVCLIFTVFLPDVGEVVSASPRAIPRLQAIATQKAEVTHSSFSEVQVYGDYLYWLDRDAKTIYRVRRPTLDSSPPTVPQQIGEPQTIWSGLPLKSPVGIAVDHAGVVYVVDDQVLAVFSLTQDSPIRLLYSGAPLSRPTAIAAASGRLYIVDGGTSKLYNLDLARKEITPEYTFDGAIPDRLLAEDTDVLAYYRESRVLLHFALDKAERITNDPSELEWRQLGRSDQTTLGRGEKINLIKALGDVADLSLADGIVYFLDRSSSRLVLLPLNGSEPFSVPLSLISDQPVALAAGTDALYFVEGSPSRIRKQPSLQPITLSFVGEWTSGKIVDFYSYLQSKRLLPLKSIQVTSTTTFRDLSNDLQLLPTGYVETFQVLFCELNVSICSAEQKKLPPAGAAVPEGHAVRLTAGQSVTLPDLPIKAYITPRNLRLPLDPSIYKPEFFAEILNQSLGPVAAALGPKGLDADLLKEIIQRYNPDYRGSDILAETKGSFSIPLQGARITAVVPRGDLLNQDSIINRLAEKKNIIGSAPMFQLKPQAISSRRLGDSGTPPRLSDQSDQCLPNDPNLRSAAMDLISYCEPPPLNPPPDVGIVDYDFNEKHSAFADQNGASALEVYKKADSSTDHTRIQEVDPGRTKFEEIDHGTHIAAIIGARRQEGSMVGLLPNAKLYGVRPEDLDDALGPWWFLRVFNVSLGEEGATGGNFSGMDGLKVTLANQRLKLFILSAGNDNKRVEPSSAAGLGYLDNVLVVGATNVPNVDPTTGQRPLRGLLVLPDGEGSNRDPYNVGLVAPGEKIKSALSNGQYGLADGTSEAAPYVSGAAAALMAIEPHWSAWQIKFRLLATADLWADRPLSETVFAGELNFKRALSDTNTVVLQHQIMGKCRGDIDPESLKRNLDLKRSDVHDPIPWSRILRIKRDQAAGTQYTLIYYDEKWLDPPYNDRYNHYLRKLTKVTTAQLRANYTFRFTPTDPSNCTAGDISIVDLIDFINKGPLTDDSEQ